MTWWWLLPISPVRTPSIYCNHNRCGGVLDMSWDSSRFWFLFRIYLDYFFYRFTYRIFVFTMENLKKTGTGLSVKHVIVTAMLFMMIGTAIELYLLDHYEGLLQLIPLVCIGGSFILAVTLIFRRDRLLQGLFKLLLILTGFSGGYGAYLHLQANYEFEQEMKPTADRWDLIVESLSGALPSLAPFSMMVLALIGYSYLILLNQER